VYGDLKNQASRAGGQNGLEFHHMPQKSFLSDPRKGLAIAITKAEHQMTRTYGWNGVRSMIEDVGLNSRQRLAKDILDLRRVSIATGNSGSYYNKGMLNIVRIVQGR
jgi:hypothetical protein